MAGRGARAGDEDPERSTADVRAETGLMRLSRPRCWEQSAAFFSSGLGNAASRALSEAGYGIRYHGSPMSEREGRINVMRLPRTDPRYRGAVRHGSARARPDAGGLRRAAVRRLPRTAQRDAPGRDRGRPPGVPGGGRGHHLDEHVRGRLIALVEYGLADRVREINEAAARLSRSVADAHSTQAAATFVAGNIGPTTKSALGHRRDYLPRDGRGLPRPG